MGGCRRRTCSALRGLSGFVCLVLAVCVAFLAGTYRESFVSGLIVLRGREYFTLSMRRSRLMLSESLTNRTSQGPRFSRTVKGGIGLASPPRVGASTLAAQKRGVVCGVTLGKAHGNSRASDDCRPEHGPRLVGGLGCALAAGRARAQEVTETKIVPTTNLSDRSVSREVRFTSGDLKDSPGKDRVSGTSR